MQLFQIFTSYMQCDGTNLVGILQLPVPVHIHGSSLEVLEVDLNVTMVNYMWSGSNSIAELSSLLII